MADTTFRDPGVELLARTSVPATEYAQYKALRTKFKGDVLCWQVDQHLHPHPRRQRSPACPDAAFATVVRWAANIHFERKRGALIETTIRAPHWRRGHFRAQPCGPAHSARKLTFVAPILIHADRLGGQAPPPKAYELTTGRARP